ncbi:MAG: cytochrome b [Gammaproteobacteria bacterium]
MTALDSKNALWHPLIRALHWVMAVLVLVLMGLGWAAETWSLSLTKVELFRWHKSLGLLTLFLVFVRLGVRLYLGRPERDDSGGTLLQNLARLGHGMLYGLMVLMPLSGWVINSAANFPLKLFGWVSVPAITGPDKALQAYAEFVHLGLFWIFLTLVVVHAGAAFYHHYTLRDDVLGAMAPRFRRWTDL